MSLRAYRESVMRHPKVGPLVEQARDPRTSPEDLDRMYRTYRHVHPIVIYEVMANPNINPETWARNLGLGNGPVSELSLYAFSNPGLMLWEFSGAMDQLNPGLKRRVYEGRSDLCASIVSLAVDGRGTSFDGSVEQAIDQATMFYEEMRQSESTIDWSYIDTFDDAPHFMVGFVRKIASGACDREMKRWEDERGCIDRMTRMIVDLHLSPLRDAPSYVSSHLEEFLALQRSGVCMFDPSWRNALHDLDVEADSREDRKVRRLVQVLDSFLTYGGDPVVEWKGNTANFFRLFHELPYLDLIQETLL